jgi:hypothetical protein
MLAFDNVLEQPAYTLFIEANDTPDQVLRQMALELDSALRENFHYAYCRDLQQLGPLRVFRIRRNALITFHSVCQNEGQRAGDIKPVALHRGGNWARFFQGRVIN